MNMKDVASTVSAILCTVCIIGFVISLFVFFGAKPSERLALLGYPVGFLVLMPFTVWFYGVSKAVEEARDDLRDIKTLLQDAVDEKRTEIAS